MIRRFVLDTNILVSTLLSASSVPGLAFARAGKIGEVVYSVETLQELLEVLARPKLPSDGREDRLGMPRKFSRDCQPELSGCTPFVAGGVAMSVPLARLLLRLRRPNPLDPLVHRHHLPPPRRQRLVTAHHHEDEEADQPPPCRRRQLLEMADDRDHPIET